MKNTIYILFLFLIVSCSKTEKETQLTMLDVFPKRTNQDSFTLSFDTIKDFNLVIKNNKKFFNENSLKTYFIRHKELDIPVNFMYLFSENLPIMCYKRKNVIETNIGADSLISNDVLDFTIKNSKELLKKNFLNYGKDPNFSDKPDRFIVFIGYELKKGKVFPKEQILKQIDTFSVAYFEFLKEFKTTEKLDSLKRKYPLHLYVKEQFSYDFDKVPPPPPVPMSIEVIE